MVKVSKRQKAEIDFKNEIIQGFFNRFTNKGEDNTYWRWNDNLRIGDVVDYMMASVNRALDDKPY